MALKEMRRSGSWATSCNAELREEGECGGTHCGVTLGGGLRLSALGSMAVRLG